MMNNRRLTVFSVLVFLLFLAGNVVNATVPDTDEKNDVFYYENGIVDRENDPHTYTVAPEVDIHSVGFETTTGGTTVFLTVGGDYIEDYVYGYDYSIRIYQGNTIDFDYYQLYTDYEKNGWHSLYNLDEVETYSFDGDTLSIFLAGVDLDASTVYMEAHAVRYHSDEGMDSDWYPDGVEKSSLDTTDNIGDGSEDDSGDLDNPDGGDSGNMDTSNDGGSSSNTPGFEYSIVLLAIAFVILFFRRK